MKNEIQELMIAVGKIFLPTIEILKSWIRWTTRQVNKLHEEEE